MIQPHVQTRNEEIVNALTHGVGVLLAIAGTAILIVRGALHGDAWHVVTFSIFGAGLINLYLASTLYHSAVGAKIKSFLNRFDHSSIYILIAATYTPFTLTSLRGPVGWVIFGIIWALAIAGVVFKVWFYTSKYRTLSAWLYLAMGWIIIFAIVPVIRSVPPLSLWLLASGCITYSLGPIFYLKTSIPFGHGIFHIFILGGSICHFLSLYHLL